MRLADRTVCPSQRRTKFAPWIFSVTTHETRLKARPFKHLEPTEDQRGAKTQFDVKGAGASKDPSVKSVGITGQMTGSRADIIIGDDIEIPNNSSTQGQREKLSEHIKEFEAIIKPGGEIIFLGTPQTEHSVYNLLTDRGYDIRMWPARYPKDTKAYGERLAPKIRVTLEEHPEFAWATRYLAR